MRTKLSVDTPHAWFGLRRGGIEECPPSATIALTMSTYLLIHGAWHGGWCWRSVAPLLEARGHRVLAPDLPGHGDDRTPAAAVTLRSYTDRICEIAGAQTEPVILAGHSMGGVAITQAAENCPQYIGALVYVCAFLPRNGDSAMVWASQDRESMVNPSGICGRTEPSASSRNTAAKCFTGIVRMKTQRSPSHALSPSPWRLRGRRSRQRQSAGCESRAIPSSESAIAL